MAPSFGINTRHFIVDPIVEFIGTACFIFMGVGGAVNFLNHAAGTPLPGFAIPFCFGFSLFVSVIIWGGISGGVYNPSITLAAMLTVKKDQKIFPWPKGILYIVAQLLGGLFGSWLISLLQPEAPNAATTLAEGVSIAQGLFLEVFATFLLTMAVLILGSNHPNDAFGIGMALFVSALCAGPYTGASLNPARTLGPAIVANEFGRAHWIYYIGPTLGSLLAAGYWHFLNMFGAFKKVLDDYEGPKGRDVEKSDGASQ